MLLMTHLERLSSRLAPFTLCKVTECSVRIHERYEKLLGWIERQPGYLVFSNLAEDQFEAEDLLQKVV
jgi:hypothetical protein